MCKFSFRGNRRVLWNKERGIISILQNSIVNLERFEVFGLDNEQTRSYTRTLNYASGNGFPVGENVPQMTD